MINSVINFGNITPAVRLSFAERFIEGYKKIPTFSCLTFSDQDGTLGITVNMKFKDGDKAEIYTPAGTPALIEAILSAFNGDVTKIKDYKEEEHSAIQAEDGEDLRVEIFKTFLYSPYTVVPQQPFTSFYGEVYYSAFIELGTKCKVFFSSPNYDEMCRLYKESVEKKHAA